MSVIRKLARGQEVQAPVKRSFAACNTPRALWLAALAGMALMGLGRAALAAGAGDGVPAEPSAAVASPSTVSAPHGPAAAASRRAPRRVAQGQPPVFPPPAPVASAKACDSACVRRDANFAGQACVPLIEAKAAIDYDWLSRPFGGMFTQAEGPGSDGIIRYRGDSIRILTHNQWLRYAYECAFDPVTGKLASVQLRPGRLIPPAAVARAAGAKVGLPAPPKVLRRAVVQPLHRRHYGEPSPVSVTQARLRGGQVDTLTHIFQIPLAASWRR
jgi:hypothetical protein